MSTKTVVNTPLGKLVSDDRMPEGSMMVGVPGILVLARHIPSGKMVEYWEQEPKFCVIKDIAKPVADSE